MASAAIERVEERAVQRTPVLVTGALVTAGGPLLPVRARDISASGAQILAAPVAVTAPGDALLNRGPILAAAWIVWSSGRTAGLRFYRALNCSEIKTLFPHLSCAKAGAEIEAADGAAANDAAALLFDRASPELRPPAGRSRNRR